MNKSSECSPVALFVYNRLSNLIKTIDALKLNELSAKTDLFIFSDGPKEVSTDLEAVKLVRDYIKNISGFRSVNLKLNPINKGLARSIVDGVTEVLEEYETIIVLEDDLVVDKAFLQFMNEALDKYVLDERVMSISGYIYPTSFRHLESSTFFLNYADCFGWGTWRRGWKYFEWDARTLYQKLKEKKLMNRFNFDFSYPYSLMLRKQFTPKSTSWAVRWYGAGVLNDKLTLFPCRSLVNHIGFEGGSHFKMASWLAGFMSSELLGSPIAVDNIEVKENAEARGLYRKYLFALTILMLINKLKTIFNFKK